VSQEEPKNDQRPTLLLLPGDATPQEEQAFLDELEQVVKDSQPS
jgi:hypothetical protein